MKLLKEYGIEIDPRFKRANKEALVVFAYWVIYAIWCYVPGFIADGIPVEEYHYILGFPAWYFVSLMGYAGFVIVGAIFIARWIKNCSLSPSGKDEAHE